ncbi:MAG: flagellar basal-body MS-ring/collar protein FliF [Anaerolineae bacterium]
MSLDNIRERASELWGRLGTKEKIAGGVILLTALLLGAVALSSSGGTSYAIAYSGLTQDDAAAIVTQLQEQGIPYEVSSGESVIRVPVDQVHDVRLAMAAAGLPNGGTVGYELFDATNLGMTDFTQQLNYRRSLEGELARTIASLDAVEQARVHIVLPEDTIYSEEQKQPTASVLLKLSSGRKLTEEQVTGITHLVATSVEGLAPEDITLLDTKGQVLSDGLADETGSADSQRFAIQREYESTIEAKVSAMLDTVLGPDRAVVTAHANLDWTEIETSTEAYQPAEGGTPVVRTARELTESYAGTPAAAEGAPGTDSNLPTYTGVEAGATPGAAGSDGQYERSDTAYTYEVSKVISHTLQSPGAVTRLSVSVLVDEVTDEEQLERIRQAVATAAGIDIARGDSVLVDTVAFDRTYFEEQETEMAKEERTSQYMTAARWGAMAVAALVVLLLIRGMVMRAITPPQPAISSSIPTVLALDAEGVGGIQTMQLPNGERLVLTPEQQAVAQSVQRQHQLVAMAQKQPELVAQVVQLWLAESRQPRRG